MIRDHLIEEVRAVFAENRARAAGHRQPDAEVRRRTEGPLKNVPPGVPNAAAALEWGHGVPIRRPH